MQEYTHTHTHGYLANRNAITLIALIITIIVMIILAGVTMSMVVGDKGVLQQSQNAGEGQKYSVAKEKIQTQCEYITNGENVGKVDLEKTLKNIDALKLDEVKKAELNSDNTVLTVTLTNDEEVIITSSGKMDIGSEEPTVDFEAIKIKLQNDSVYREQLKNQAISLGQDESTEDIGIGTDGNVVNLDLWKSTKIGANSLQLSQGSWSTGYKGKIDSEGKIEGTIPQIIFSEGIVYEVTSLYYTFYNIKDLVISPEIPSTVTDTSYMFYGCENLKEAPEILNGVTDTRMMFSECTSLEAAPEIPNGVTSVRGMFWECTSLREAPVIPTSVNDVSGMFYGCESLSGTITINIENLGSDSYYYENMLQEVGSAESQIILTGEASMEILERIRGTGNAAYITIVK